MIQEIHLIHHTHTDIGYTDLPSTSWKLHIDYIRQALTAAQHTSSYPEEARFHWTCEALTMVEAFLKIATPEERTTFDTLVATGQFEVTAMPFNITPFLTAPEWHALTTRHTPLWRAYHARTAFQNDINGLPWGLLPTLKANGIDYIWMGMNTYSGGSPLPRPTAFWWEGPTGERLLTWIGYGYGDGYSWFHEHEWRRGPVPSITDIWFHPPTTTDIFASSPAALERAFTCLQQHLATIRPDYPFSILPLQITNRWRIDNDPPCPALSTFVRAWNAANLQPQLRLSTPQQFFSALEQQVGPDLPTLRGDWADWWADGSTSTPVELALNQHTKRLLADLPAAATLLASTPDKNALTSTWELASLMDEHTWGAYESVAYPYKPRSMGNWLQKMNLAYQANEDAQHLQATLIRHNPYYLPSSHTRKITVLNPGSQPRSNWVSISARALREPYNAVRDLETSTLYPLEDLPSIEWDRPDPDLQRPFTIPNDTWSPVIAQKRFYVSNLPPHASIRFELLQTELPVPPTAPSTSANTHFTWQWNTTTGHLQNWTDRNTGFELLDTHAPYPLGAIIVELPQGKKARAILSDHPAQSPWLTFKRDLPNLIHWTPLPSSYSARYHKILEHPHCHHIEQHWDFFHDLPRLEITTTFWLKELATPQAIFLAFPWSFQDFQASYTSLGHLTRVGHDQLPGSCGEYLATNEAVTFTTPNLTLTLNTPDTPLGTFGTLHPRDGHRASITSQPHFYSYITQNYWETNFSITKAAHLTTRHILDLTPISPTPPTSTYGELWPYPSL